MIIRQGAFTGSRRLLKGALHTHTTRSDGTCSPEALLAEYEAQHYDFVAITDHRTYNRQSFGSRMTILPGMEVDVCFAGTRGRECHVFHTVCLGPVDGRGFEQDEAFPSFDICHPSEFQTFLDDLHGRGCKTFYCHPQWSHTPVHEYMGQRGHFAMELYNTGCALENELDVDNGIDWEYVLDSGNRIYGVAVDDCHQAGHIGYGYVRVNAENTQNDILDALVSGNFYASCGPEILDFYVEDGTAVLSCASADVLTISCSGIPRNLVSVQKDRPAQISLELPPSARFVRGIAILEGRRAWTNPIWLP